MESITWAERYPEERKRVAREWAARNTNSLAYHSQKAIAKRRGIGFHFTKQAWLDWWGEDINKRGRAAENLVMARYGDDGDYEESNVYKTTKSENARGPQWKV